MQVIVDDRADGRQREALTKIVHGEETDEGATHWWVYRSMSDTVHETLVKSIEFDVDIEARTARVAIPGVLESVGRPIVSPATGQEHRVLIEIPNGIEFERAEIGSATIVGVHGDTAGSHRHLRSVQSASAFRQGCGSRVRAPRGPWSLPPCCAAMGG